MYNKYKATKKECLYGHKHDSVKEAQRCNELHLLMRAGEISELNAQVRFELLPFMKYENMPNEKSCCYVADFVYKDNKTGKMIVEDTKGFKTPDYVIKRKLFKAKYHSDYLFLET